MLKLISDNSDKYYDKDLQEYCEEKPTELPFSLVDDEGIIIGMFPIYKGAICYQMGMGLRASTTIEVWDD